MRYYCRNSWLTTNRLIIFFVFYHTHVFRSRPWPNIRPHVWSLSLISLAPLSSSMTQPPWKSLAALRFHPLAAPSRSLRETAPYGLRNSEWNFNPVLACVLLIAIKSLVLYTTAFLRFLLNDLREQEARLIARLRTTWDFLISSLSPFIRSIELADKFLPSFIRASIILH